MRYGRLWLGLLMAVAGMAGVLRWLDVGGIQECPVARQAVTPFVGLELPAVRDFVADPQVAPEERNAGPARIISLAPSITEIICALGMADRLIGRTPYCTYPPAVQSVEMVGALMDTNLARICSLRPDVVLLTRNSGQVPISLRELNIPYEAVPHESLADVYAAIEQIGTRCGRPRTAAMLVQAIRADVDRLRKAQRQHLFPSKRVLLVLGPLPVPPKALFVAGPGSFLNSLLELGGHVNVATAVSQSSYGEIPMEQLCELDPEVIVEFREDTEIPEAVYAGWTELGCLRAIRDRHVRSMSPQWLCAGPRIAIELRQMMLVLAE